MQPGSGVARPGQLLSVPGQYFFNGVIFSVLLLIF